MHKHLNQSSIRAIIILNCGQEFKKMSVSDNSKPNFCLQVTSSYLNIRYTVSLAQVNSLILHIGHFQGHAQVKKGACFLNIFFFKSKV